MRLYDNTGCNIVLIGLLKEVPQLRMDEQGNLMMTIGIVTQHINKIKKTFEYSVIVFGDAALRIKQCGSPNIRLWVEGNLQLEKNSNIIIAKKIAFLIDPEPFATHEYVNTFNFISSSVKTNELVSLH